MINILIFWGLESYYIFVCNCWSCYYSVILNFELWKFIVIKIKGNNKLKKGCFWFCFKCVSDFFFIIIELLYIYGMNLIFNSFIWYIGIFVNFGNM